VDHFAGPLCGDGDDAARGFRWQPSEETSGNFCILELLAIFLKLSMIFQSFDKF
jgi:hypothetical protein